MEFKEDVKRIFPLIILVILGILTFFLLRPIMIPIVGGLILAYIFNPLYKRLLPIFKNKTLAAWAVLFLVVIIIALPLWFIIPVLITQVFEAFKSFQLIDLSVFLNKIFPTASEEFMLQITTIVSSFIGKISSLVLNGLASLFINALNVLISLVIVGFVFFYAMRDSDKLKAAMKDISPISKSRERTVIKQFQDITNSLVYGQIVVGLVQGTLAGLGLFIFGVPNALVLTAAAIILSIVPVVGPSPIWIPVSIYLFIASSPAMAIAFVLYNVFVVSTVDNLIRTHFVARRISMSPALVLLGMIGGLFLFGIMGLILGPLILVYLITFWQYYKEGYAQIPAHRNN